MQPTEHGTDRQWRGWQDTPGKPWCRRWLIAVGLAAVIVLALPQRNWAQVEENWAQVEEHAARAKAQGLTSIRINRSDPVDRVTLSEQIRFRSIVVLRLARVDVARTTEWLGIQTWHTFTIEQSLSEPEVSASHLFCGPLPPALTVLPNEIAIPFEGGTVDVDGVAVTVVPRWQVQPMADRRYLAFLVQCENRSARVLDDMYGWFEVSEDGRIQSDASIQVDPRSEVIALGTLQRLRQRLAR